MGMKLLLITKQAVKTMLDIKFHHVGIGAGDRGAQLAALINSPHQNHFYFKKW